MRYLVGIALCVTLMVSGTSWGGQREAVDAYNKKDYATALKEFRPLARAGNAQAQLLMGLMYDNGLGTARNFAEALRWYKLAADQGVARAQFNIGQLYEAGEGVARDVVEAHRWYAIAADNGFAEAQYRYGLALSEGKHLPRDLVAAYQWLALAASQPVPGAEQAAAARDLLQQHMTPAEIAQGKQRMEQWINQRKAIIQGKQIDI